jgi:toxin ParE1/3/4
LATEATETVANDFVDGITAAFEPLRRLPFAGVMREQLAPGLRGMFHRTYAIYYKPVSDALVIIRVLHGARDIAAIADHGGFAE